MKGLLKKIKVINRKIEEINKKYSKVGEDKEHRSYTRELMENLNHADELLESYFRAFNILYNLAPEEGIIDIFVTYNILNSEKAIIPPPNTRVYPLSFPYTGIRGPKSEVDQIVTEYLGKTASALMSPILGNEPLDVTTGEFKAASILKPVIGLDGEGTLIGIIDTGIDYTNPVFIDSNGETRILSIWDQTIGIDSPYGYGTVYDKDMINKALKSPDPFEIVPHKDEWGHGTILAGIAAGSGAYEKGLYRGVAPGSELVIVKLKPASEAMQKLFHGKYNPLGFSALDIALAFRFLVIQANQIQKPISICLPSGTNSGAHDGTSVLEQIISSYSSNPGICAVVSVGEEANKAHHASGNLNEKKEQKIKLTIPEGQLSFVAEIWFSFSDRIDVLLTPPKMGGDASPDILLNEGQTAILSEGSSIWSQGTTFNRDTGNQMIRFRFEKPVQGEWLITLKGTIVIEGRYNIWIPKTGMILPKTVLSPENPFTTIYSTSAAVGVIAMGCYDKKSQSTCGSSGRGFTGDNRVKPDYIVDGVDIPGPLPGNKWGVITGTAPAAAITVGSTSIIYENQLRQEDELANTVIMKGILAGRVIREPTIVYPNPSSGYGIIDINSDVY